MALRLAHQIIAALIERSVIAREETRQARRSSEELRAYLWMLRQQLRHPVDRDGRERLLPPRSSDDS